MIRMENYKKSTFHCSPYEIRFFGFLPFLLCRVPYSYHPFNTDVTSPRLLTASLNKEHKKDLCHGYKNPGRRSLW